MRRHLHFDCFSGISGDMTLAAMIELGAPEETLRSALDSLDLPGRLVVSRVDRQGFAATKVDVETPAENTHRHLRHILEILDRAAITRPARELAERMFRRLAEAEARCHGTTVEKVHFHEVGAVDSIFDFVGVAVAFDWLGPERVTSTPVPTGSGWVTCEHGRIPVPAPAVVELLTGVPLATSPARGELTTPTGAAILAAAVDEFVESPPLTVRRVGLGAGSRDLERQPNLLRLLWGESADAAKSTDADGAAGTPAASVLTTSTKGDDRYADSVWQLETNIDDQSPEIIGHCFDLLLAAGALDVYAIPIHMKKSRLGTLLTALCDDERLARIEATIFRETGTFGIRKRRVGRSTLARRHVEVATDWGTVRGKLGWNHDVRVASPEYEDCARIAREHGVALRDVYRQAARALDERIESPSPAEATS